MGGGPELDPLIGLDDPSKPLRSRLLQVPSIRARYLEHVRSIAETWLDWKKIGPIAEGFHEQIADAVKADTRKLGSTEGFERSLTRTDAAEGTGRVTTLRDFIERRRAYLLKYAPPAAPAAPTTEKPG